MVCGEIVTYEFQRRGSVEVSGEVSVLGLVISLLFVVLPVVLSFVHRLALARSVLGAVIRALVQLTAAGALLVFVFESDTSLLWSWVWGGGMILFAAYTVYRRAPEVPGMFFIGLRAFTFAAIVTWGVLFGFAIVEISPMTIVPLTGMMIGNSLNALVLVARAAAEGVRENRDEIEARLALGLSSVDAARPVLRRALRTGLTPQIETLRALGVVYLPGAMTGLILAGMSPFSAVRMQLVIMYMVLGATCTNVTVAGIGVIRKSFTTDHRLAPHIFR